MKNKHQCKVPEGETAITWEDVQAIVGGLMMVPIVGVLGWLVGNWLFPNKPITPDIWIWRDSANEVKIIGGSNAVYDVTSTAEIKIRDIKN